MKNVFDIKNVHQILDRIEKLTPETKNNWGKMNVAQMLAHCNVTYELVYDKKHPRPSWFMGIILKVLIKNFVVNTKLYKKNIRTAPVFLIREEKDFYKEKKRLIEYIKKTQELGENYFNNRESHSFGRLKKVEWSNMFYKHLDHHLQQFGA